MITFLLIFDIKDISICSATKGRYLQDDWLHFNSNFCFKNFTQFKLNPLQPELFSVKFWT